MKIVAYLMIDMDCHLDCHLKNCMEYLHLNLNHHGDDGSYVHFCVHFCVHFSFHYYDDDAVAERVMDVGVDEDEGRDYVEDNDMEGMEEQLEENRELEEQVLVEEQVEEQELAEEAVE